jgi:hypothetical protein
MLAYFDLEIGGHLRIYNLMLRRNTESQLRTVAPQACGKHATGGRSRLDHQQKYTDPTRITRVRNSR